MRALVDLAGLWVANEIAGGRIPKKLALPLGFLVSRLGTPPLMIGLLGYVLWQLNRDQGRDKRRPGQRRSSGT